MKSLTAAVLGVMGATTAVAYANVEVGGIAGVHIFKDDKLGVVDKADPATQSNTALFGLRLGVFFGNSLGVELEGGVLPTEGTTSNNVFGVTDVTARAHLAYQFRAANAENSMIPFIVAGGGIMRLVDSKATDFLKKDTQVTVYVGVGLKYRASHNWGVRGDLRGILTPKVDSGFTQNAELLLSVYREWGRPTKSVIAAPVKEDPDPDKDGIVGAADKCPTQAEDKDGFEDENGCPDPDNDGDGIADATDKCPVDPEDKDGFQDEDGCPDPDNDGDGVPDAADQCALEPETRNGFQDDDGCPDEIPEKLKAFTGVIQGITFKVSVADLQPASFKVLDKAVAVLAEFKDIKLEIQGHTDDQPLKGSKVFADNQALSQARAESVKAYFVSKGIEEGRLAAKGYGETAPVESPTGLKAGKLAAARAKNRRVEFKLIMAEGAVPPPATPEPAPAPAPTP
ncbi:MAG: OmpA family protein [Polyangiales bacterium]